MDPAAHVSSLEAIDSFRATLIVYLSKARVLIDDAADEIARTREWLRSDRLPFWESQVRRRKRRLDEAQQALFSGRLSTFRTASSAEQAAVHSARHALQEAENKLLQVKRWLNRFDAAVDLPAKQIEQVRGLVVGRLPGGVAQLGRIVEKLHVYAETPSAPVLEPPASEPSSAAAPEAPPPASEGGERG